ncbi:MAG: GAF domain-containing protein [Desulfuromonadales bacterium]|nr:GAF domain-containing protein [Desulfuromonadales bacterium]
MAAFARFLVDLAAASTKAEKGSLLFPDRSGEELFILCARGISPTVVFEQRFRFGQGICGRVARSLRPLFVREIEKDRRYCRRPRHDYVSPSFMVFPIVYQGRLLALLTLSGRQDGGLFDENDFQFGLALAETAASPLKALTGDLKGELASGGFSLPAVTGSDWRNRLHAIHGAVYYLRHGRNLSAGQQAEFLDLIASETGRLIALTEQ